MKKYLFLLLMFLSTPSTFAQTSANPDKQALYNAEVREKLALDYSLPDYSVKKIDEKIIGHRFAKQLQYLMARYKDQVINSNLSGILYEQTGDLRYTEVTKIKILQISKQGNTISIRIKASLAPNPLKLSTSEIPITFIEGVSDSKSANSIFCYISRYIKE